MRIIFIITFSLILFFSCVDEDSSQHILSTPLETEEIVKDDFISKLTHSDVELIHRYLAANPCWDMRHEQGTYYAIRKQKINGVFKTTKNGFYSSGMNQTRVLISFTAEYGLGEEYNNITRVNVKQGEKYNVILEEEGSSNCSYTIFKGAGINIEIYDQASFKKRYFTKRTFAEITSEFRKVLKYPKELHATGIVPVPELYPAGTPKEKSSIRVDDGPQSGIYSINAYLQVPNEGEVFVRVFNSKTGQQLSEDTVTINSRRVVPVSVDKKIFYPYSSVIKVFEGDWTHKYNARFELWHKSKSGVNSKLMETSRMINGWQR